MDIRVDPLSLEALEMRVDGPPGRRGDRNARENSPPFRTLSMLFSYDPDIEGHFHFTFIASRCAMDDLLAHVDLLADVASSDDQARKHRFDASEAYFQQHGHAFLLRHLETTSCPSSAEAAAYASHLEQGDRERCRALARRVLAEPPLPSLLLGRLRWLLRRWAGVAGLSFLHESHFAQAERIADSIADWEQGRRERAASTLVSMVMEDERPELACLRMTTGPLAPSLGPGAAEGFDLNFVPARSTRLHGLALDSAHLVRDGGIADLIALLESDRLNLDDQLDGHLKDIALDDDPPSLEKARQTALRASHARVAGRVRRLQEALRGVDPTESCLITLMCKDPFYG
ncbi:MAG: hypothetical protein AB8I08_08240 [Sandaracinaceae bacterium]